MDTSYTIVLEDQTVLSSLCGANDENLHVFETYLGVPVICRGNEVTVVTSDQAICKRFQKLIDTLLESPEITSDGSADFIASCVANSAPQQGAFCPQCIHIPRGIKSVYPKNRKQAALIDSIYANDITFGLGPAGTGKTYIAVALALKMLLSHTVRKLILTRPVVEAGESLGFLPGDLVQKINPYLRPLFDIMETLLPADVLRGMEESNTIEVAPLAYMRGRTLHNAVVILDEAQNTTKEQMKMFLTRMGEGSKLIITGDPSQSDIRGRSESGLVHAVSLIRTIDGIGTVEFSADEVVRHSLVQKIINAYEKQ
ncbi:MAG: PhoH family protein [Treponema sp.]|uniref:PhoH family protein n=1 Tax=unclassified Treponema TaxID=2638727 RepID=UPI0020A504F4|nr:MULTISPECIES: PhoH family protein [unclassified Treponema]UTC52501.1 PhoH family protein [Treponema sp. OMZ 803]UTC54913.1 PhoH family protein [Treponema sp. OMZ 906]